MTTHQYVADDCEICTAEIAPETLKLTGNLCYQCREKQAKQERTSWCVLTPHKQGAMYFTAEFAIEAVKGINNKGGLIK
jgi:hypothetical protein